MINKEFWKELEGQRLFITGGTGFFGKHLLFSLLEANKRFGLKVSATVLSRNPTRFLNQHSHFLNCEYLKFIEGDVCNFQFPEGSFSHIIHAAADADPVVVANHPKQIFNTVVLGTERMLEFSQKAHAQRMLFVSSGAVYGTQPSQTDNISESVVGEFDPDNPRQAYAVSKRKAEKMCESVASQCEIKIARCFAFLGPYLPLDGGFAIGNFLRNKLNGEPISILGDGTAIRSYMYSSDLIEWLWTILFRGKNLRPYNVGSDVAVSIGELAEMIDAMGQSRNGVRYQSLLRGASHSNRYVPSVDRCKSELGLDLRVDLKSAIQNTIDWYRGQKGNPLC